MDVDLYELSNESSNSGSRPEINDSLQRTSEKAGVTYRFKSKNNFVRKDL